MVLARLSVRFRLLLLSWLAGTMILGSVPAFASFVHAVGRDYMIREWIEHDLDAELIEITPVMHEGNPVYRVVYRVRNRSDDEPAVQVLLRADDFRDMKPVVLDGAP